MFFSRKCPKCEIYKEQIEYLKKMVDNLLVDKGVAPVIPQEETILEETDQEKADRALKERGGERYGD